jgi:kumamolisin
MIKLTLVLRQPEAAAGMSARLLAGTFNPAEMQASDLAASPADVEAVLAFAREHRLQVVRADPAARTIRVSGSAADIAQAFGIEQQEVEALRYKGPITLSAPLDEIVSAVLGLDQSPVARSLG